ncbi:ion channel [Acuticoccus sp.]|uniref:ion channel n=1 Tax=Acuticoccus sp. TaxID=1904378 RepID=UPI003B51B4CB
MRRSPLAILLAAFVATATPCLGQDGPVVVGAPDRPPFAFTGSDGAWQGIAIDLWRMSAEELGLAYEIVPLEADGAGALGGGTVDVALAVDATAEGEASADYLMPFYTATLAVASEREFVLARVLSSLFSIEFARIVAALSVLLLAVGAVVWALERRRNADQFHARALPGLGDGFWWAGVTLTTIGYGDKAPITFLGRAVAMLWMLMGLAVSAALTASVISVVNLEAGRTLSVPADLAERRVAVVEGSSAGAYLASLDVDVTPVASFGAALDALAGGAVDAVAGGAPELRSAVARSGLELTISTTTQDPQYVTLALASEADEALFEELNRAILRRITSDEWWALVERYLPSE